METGGRVALPVFKDLMLRVYRGEIVGPAPAFPAQMEEHITRYLHGDAPALVVDRALPAARIDAPRGHAFPAESEWFLHHATVLGPITAVAKKASVRCQSLC